MIKHSLSLSPRRQRKEKACLSLCKGILRYWPCMDTKGWDAETGRGDPGGTSGLCSSF